NRKLHAPNRTDVSGRIMLDGLKHFAAYETKPSPGIGIVVTKESATKGAEETPLAVPKNHTELAKPANTSDEPVPWLKGILTTCLATCGQPLQDAAADFE